MCADSRTCNSHMMQCVCFNRFTAGVTKELKNLQPKYIFIVRGAGFIKGCIFTVKHYFIRKKTVLLLRLSLPHTHWMCFNLLTAYLVFTSTSSSTIHCILTCIIHRNNALFICTCFALFDVCVFVEQLTRTTLSCLWKLQTAGRILLID